MTRAEVVKLISGLRVSIRPSNLKLSNPQGREGRLDKLSGVVTQLVKEERLVATYSTGSEARNYAERLISEAIRHGDTHKPTMEMASFWLKEKQLVHKLFKVLVPRFKDTSLSYTKMYNAPFMYPALRLEGAMEDQCNTKGKVVLELRQNKLPPIVPKPIPTRNWIHNVLLEEARKEHYRNTASDSEEVD